MRTIALNGELPAMYYSRQGYHFDPGKTRERMAAVAAVARTLGGS